jgi:hypothetical protein
VRALKVGDRVRVYDVCRTTHRVCEDTGTVQDVRPDGVDSWAYTVNTVALLLLLPSCTTPSYPKPAPSDYAPVVRPSPLPRPIGARMSGRVNPSVEAR